MLWRRLSVFWSLPLTRMDAAMGLGPAVGCFGFGTSGPPFPASKAGLVFSVN